MPLLPLPVGGSVLSGDLPIIDMDSVAALEPLIVRDSDNAPVRDAVRAALVAMFTYYQDKISEAAMQSNVLFATGIYLDGLGRDEGVFRKDSEPYTSTGDAAYRARIITQGGTVTPDAIMAAVNAILAPYTDIAATYMESILDRGFCRDDTSTAFVAYVRDGVTAGSCDPTYADRLYPNDAADNLGQSIASRRPGGFFCFSDIIGRYVIIRIPSLAALDTTGAFAYSSPYDGTTLDPAVTYGYGLFCTNGTVTAPTWWDFFRDAPAISTAVYQTIVNTVNRIIGHSIRWQLLVDPLLT